ncbi:hypothetical protein [Novosphingobium sp. PhB165]|uniref:hypothetical protein n=1 Tax=Novosphingobium sp. PhB165 TaxID=2485105 RepID=UPI001404ACCE|nr:hypothetical protein [Novosphingobium sp. PhB165]
MAFEFHAVPIGASGTLVTIDVAENLPDKTLQHLISPPLIDAFRNAIALCDNRKLTVVVVVIRPYRIATGAIAAVFFTQ